MCHKSFSYAKRTNLNFEKKMILAFTSWIFRLEIYHIETFPLCRRKMTLFCAEGKEAVVGELISYFSIGNIFSYLLNTKFIYLFLFSSNFLGSGIAFIILNAWTLPGNLCASCVCVCVCVCVCIYIYIYIYIYFRMEDLQFGGSVLLGYDICV